MIAKLGYGGLMLNEGTFICFITLFNNCGYQLFIIWLFGYQLFIFSRLG